MISHRYTASGALTYIVFAWLIIPVLTETFLILLLSREQIPAILRVIIYGLLLGATIYLVWMNFQKRPSGDKRSKLIKLEAKSHGYLYDHRSSIDIRSDNFKQSQQRDVTLSNSLSGEGWNYGELEYYLYIHTRKGDYREVALYYSVIQLDLGRELPNIVFESKVSHHPRYRWKFESYQTTSLEGNFDKYFTTYFPEHYHIDARSIISPEVMAALIDVAPADIEIYRNKLYIYSALRPVEELAEYIELGKRIRSVLIDHVKHYIDDFDGDRQQKTISNHGIKLREHFVFPWKDSVLGLASFLCLAYVLTIYVPEIVKDPMYTFNTVGISAILIFGMWNGFYKIHVWNINRNLQREQRSEAKKSANKRYEKYR